MRLTKHTAYALRILMHCAVHDDRIVRTAELADALHMTPANAVKTVRALTEHGFLTATRGRSGGVRLGRPADAITIADLVRALEPTRVEADCIGFEIDCGLRALSPLNRAFDDALSAFIGALEPHTIASLVERQRRTALAQAG